MREKKTKSGVGRGEKRGKGEGVAGRRFWSGAVWESGELVMI
jgi:hypothetical protein